MREPGRGGLCARLLRRVACSGAGAAAPFGPRIHEQHAPFEEVGPAVAVAHLVGVLMGERLLRRVRVTGADVVHPGAEGGAEAVRHRLPAVRVAPGRRRAFGARFSFMRRTTADSAMSDGGVVRLAEGKISVWPTSAARRGTPAGLAGMPVASVYARASTATAESGTR